MVADAGQPPRFGYLGAAKCGAARPIATWRRAAWGPCRSTVAAAPAVGGGSPVGVDAQHAVDGVMSTLPAWHSALPLRVNFRRTVGSPAPGALVGALGLTAEEVLQALAAAFAARRARRLDDVDRNSGPPERFVPSPHPVVGPLVQEVAGVRLAVEINVATFSSSQSGPGSSQKVR